MNNPGRQSIVLLSLAGLLLCGCNVETHKDGKNDDVSIGTPFGSMQVKTNDSTNKASIGITQYPGSVPYHDKDSDHNSDSADINMSFGSFHLTVKAASFQTSDPEDKILAFYRGDLKRYGDVIECKGHNPVGKPDRTSQGLTCDDNSGSKHGNIDFGSGIELRAGSPQRQHIVGIENKNGSTKIALVALDLPSQIHSHDDKEIE